MIDYNKMLKKDLVSELVWRDNELNRLRRELQSKWELIEMLKNVKHYDSIQGLAQGLDATSHAIVSLNRLIERKL